jgi:hypothetical protein
MLMMGFTADGQADPAMVATRDQRFAMKSEEKRKDRESIPAPPIAQGADAWQQGDVLQLALQPLAKGAAVSHSHAMPATAPQSLAPPAGAPNQPEK